jgi:hypothetical protein
MFSAKMPWKFGSSFHLFFIIYTGKGENAGTKVAPEPDSGIVNRSVRRVGAAEGDDFKTSTMV